MNIKAIPGYRDGLSGKKVDKGPAQDRALQITG